MANVHNVGSGFFPLDEELELLPGGLTPHGHEHIVRLAAWMPFDKAVEILRDMQGIQISKSQSRRYTEQAGAAYIGVQEEELGRNGTEEQHETAGTLQISVDGAMVPLLHGQWGEAKTLVVGEVHAAEKDEQVVHTQALSYFSRKMNAEKFADKALVELQRRGVMSAKRVLAVMDGADWEQGFVDYHCPQAVRILDFPHAAEHISAIGEYLFGENTPESQQWLEKRLHQLKQEGPASLLAEFRQLAGQNPDAKEVSANLAYLEKRENQMQYPYFQAQGWPIGSGIVESGNKLVVEARLKGSGMHWEENNVNSMLALRNILCSDRWKTEWPKIEQQLRHQKSIQRRELHQPIEKPKVIPPPITIRDYTPQVVDALSPVKEVPRAVPKKNCWGNFKYGRSLYQPKTSAKK